jgi:hypothetical protein
LEFKTISGLELNYDKCEVAFMGEYSNEVYEQVAALLPGIKLADKTNLELLGSPIYQENMVNSIRKKKDDLTRMCDRLLTIDAQSAIFLFRHSIGAPRSNYLLRSSQCYVLGDLLSEFDEIQRITLRGILNIELDESAWNQASLPMRNGGLGIRKISDLALPAYISSATRSKALVSMLAPASVIEHDLSISSSLSKLLDEIDHPGDLEALTQNCQIKMDKLVSDATFKNLFDNANKIDRARMLASTHKDSARWMHAIPCEGLGTKVDNATTRIAIALRLGSKIVVPHTCRCSRGVDEWGRHGLSCEKSAGRQSRHSQINDIFSRALTSASIPNIREVVGLASNDNKRPDGMTLIPYSTGRPLVWDATVSDLFAASNVDGSSKCVGFAANAAEVVKINKYKDITVAHMFTPIAFDTFGVAGEETRSTLKSLAKRLVVATKEARAGEYLLQRLSLEIIRGNAISVMGTFNSNAPQLQELEFLVH